MRGGRGWFSSRAHRRRVGHGRESLNRRGKVGCGEGSFVCSTLDEGLMVVLQRSTQIVPVSKFPVSTNSILLIFHTRSGSKTRCSRLTV